MATNFPALNQLMDTHRALLRQGNALNALLSSGADLVKFVCDVPPFQGTFAVELPRSVWGAIVQAKVDGINASALALDVATAAYLAKAP